MRSLLPVLLLLVAPSLAPAREVFVDVVAGSDTLGDGSSLAPWRTVTHALTHGLVDGDHVRLAAGRHDAGAGERFPLLVPSGVSLHGAEPPGVTIIASDEPAAAAIATTVGTLVVPSWGFDRLHLEGPGPATASIGIDLAMGRGEGPTVSRSTVSGFGTGVRHHHRSSGQDPDQDSRPFVTESLITANDVGLLVDADVTASGGRLRERTEMWNNRLVANRIGVALRARCAGCPAGTMTLRGVVVNNTIADNREDGLRVEVADCAGGALTQPDLANNIIAWNAVSGVFLGPCATLGSDAFNDYWANPSGNGLPPANLTVDPGFVDRAAGDYHLAPGSLCVDAADPLEAPPIDFEGDPRPLDGDGDQVALADIGADELRPVPPLVLRRASFARIDPPVPARADVFPFSDLNPFTPAIQAPFLSGDRDPVLGILTDPRVPMAFYQVGPESVPAVLHAIKDANAETIVFTLR